MTDRSEISKEAKSRMKAQRRDFISDLRKSYVRKSHLLKRHPDEFPFDSVGKCEERFKSESAIEDSESFCKEWQEQAEDEEKTMASYMSHRSNDDDDDDDHDITPLDS